MNRKIFLLPLLVLLSCVNKHSASETTWRSADGYVSDERTAVKIAEAVWVKVYGDHVRERRPFRATLRDSSVWIVEGTLPAGHVGGVPYAEIQKSDGKILRVYHTK